ncbi:hypothetical protein, partial [Vandammella animalimorsus]|uniref:hypothetical protein n=1 Tax=Vandammella animalimorsus TaxID=2029117 RepID=UPI001EEE4BA7
PAQAGRSQPHETPAEVASKGQAVLSKGLRQICGLRDLSIQVVCFLLNKNPIDWNKSVSKAGFRAQCIERPSIPTGVFPCPMKK